QPPLSRGTCPPNQSPAAPRPLPAASKACSNPKPNRNRLAKDLKKPATRIRRRRNRQPPSTNRNRNSVGREIQATRFISASADLLAAAWLTYQRLDFRLR